MNRRDALKSIIAAPMAAAVPTPASPAFDFEAFCAQTVVLDGEPPRDGEEAIVLEYPRFDHMTQRIRTHHRPVGLAPGRNTIIRLPMLHQNGGFDIRTLTDSGRRDAQHRRIYA